MLLSFLPLTPTPMMACWAQTGCLPGGGLKEGKSDSDDSSWINKTQEEKKGLHHAPLKPLYTTKRDRADCIFKWGCHLPRQPAASYWSVTREGHWVVLCMNERRFLPLLNTASVLNFYHWASQDKKKFVASSGRIQEGFKSFLKKRRMPEKALQQYIMQWTKDLKCEAI